TDPVTSASGLFHFDDNGQAYINGQLIVDDTGGGASNFDLTLDPGLFVVGENLVAVHGIDTIAPDNSIGVNMTINTVPEPAVLGLLSCACLAMRRPARVAITRVGCAASSAQRRCHVSLRECRRLRRARRHHLR